MKFSAFLHFFFSICASSVESFRLYHSLGYHRWQSSIKMSDSSNNEENGELSPGFRPIVPKGFEKLTNSDWADSKNGIIPIGPDETNPEESKSTKLDVSTMGASVDAVRYYKIMESVTPQELIMKFAQTAPKNVQEATKSTIMNLLGSLPNYALDAALVTTNVKLASLLYQMQITGYMFKNAEYRMSLTRSLKGVPKLPSSATIKKDNYTIIPSEMTDSVTGEVTITTTTGEVVKVSVQELTRALGHEVNELRQELASIKNERESELKANLLTYVQALPEKELGVLTTDMSGDVIQAIQLLIGAVMEKIGVEINGPELMIQQSVANLAQLCMWQMVLGYRLREMEALDRGIPLD